jgi:RNase H-fold protein (predicted Holliday junction resolvase)
MKKSKRQAKGSLDAISASLILQRHLDATARGGLG